MNAIDVLDDSYLSIVLIEEYNKIYVYKKSNLNRVGLLDQIICDGDPSKQIIHIISDFLIYLWFGWCIVGLTRMKRMPYVKPIMMNDDRFKSAIMKDAKRSFSVHYMVIANKLLCITQNPEKLKVPGFCAVRIIVLRFTRRINEKHFLSIHGG